MKLRIRMRTCVVRVCVVRECASAVYGCVRHVLDKRRGREEVCVEERRSEHAHKDDPSAYMRIQHQRYSQISLVLSVYGHR